MHLIPKREVFVQESVRPTRRFSARPRYEKAHVTSSIISAIKAPMSITKLDLRTRRMGGDAYPFSPRLNGVPLTASTNRISFTYRFYQTIKSRNNSKGPPSKNKFIAIYGNAKKSRRIEVGSFVSYPVRFPPESMHYIAESQETVGTVKRSDERCDSITPPTHSDAGSGSTRPHRTAVLSADPTIRSEPYGVSKAKLCPRCCASYAFAKDFVG